MASSNPFATRFTRPGAIEYLPADGRSVEDILAALKEASWWGEIVGPHGSGKSTLLASLLPACQKAGKRTVWRVIRGPGMRPAPLPDNPLPASAGHATSLPEPRAEIAASFAAATQDSSSWDGNTLLVLDGYEQLGWWAGRRVQTHCRRRGVGLLVTAHRPLGLPTLARLWPTEALAEKVVSRLLPAGDQTITREDVRQAFSASGDNLRETLFALYDVYRSRQSTQEREPPGEV